MAGKILQKPELAGGFTVNGAVVMDGSGNPPGALSTGNVHYVKKLADTDHDKFVANHQSTYADGTFAVYDTADLAFAAAKKNDTIIFCAPDSGGHDLTNTITITQLGLKVFGDQQTAYNQRCTIKNPTTSSGTNMFLVKADKVEFGYLTLQNRCAGACIIFGDTAGQAYYQPYIHDCNMTDYGGVATYGVTPGLPSGANNDMPDPVNLVVENCVFDGFVTAAIHCNGTRDCYKNNFIKTAAGAAGIWCDKHTDSRGYGIVRGNYILGVNSTDTGILVSADTGSAAGLWAIAENSIENASASITKQTNLQGFDNNDAASATGAKTAIDIVT